MKKTLVLIITLILCLGASAEDGHQLWLRYQQTHAQVNAPQGGDILNTACRELRNYWLGQAINLQLVSQNIVAPEGYAFDGKTLKASTESGLLYGAYALLREQTVRGTAKGIILKSTPKSKYRILNHWDNLDGSIERGYAGKSIFWNSPIKGEAYDTRLKEYARANASVGINGTVLDNVNASPKMLTHTYLDSVAHIANILRPYGLRVYLSVNFGTPKALGATNTADPLNKRVINWWNKKAKEIYKLIPDFGGFCVKANSEGQPGPFDYGRTHAQGANMLADALKPYGGLVFWRSFVYGSKHKGEDRVKQAVSEFADLDGTFRENVILQSKNGPLDFQPREPYAPIFDQMHRTTQAVELQITQEYLGHDKHLVYLAPMWQEFFSFVSVNRLKGVVGVANIGDHINWCGHPFAQSNWYAFGRLAWDASLNSKTIGEEWLIQTYTDKYQFVAPVLDMMLSSREACVDYMEPLGLHHIMAFDHHYGPEPDGFIASYPIEWCPVYYHKADAHGLGFERSSKGTNATAQYPEPYRSLYDNLATCPPEYLLWFHHVAWNYRMPSGRTMWQELNAHYNKGVKTVQNYENLWQQMKPYIDEARWQHTANLLHLQEQNAELWRNTCLKYFATFSKMPIE